MTAHNFGVLVGALTIPLIGLALLIVGIVQRTRPQPPPPIAPYYPQAGPWPAPPAKPRGTGLIVAGSVIVVLSMIGGVVRVAGMSQDLASSPRPSASSAPSVPRFPIPTTRRPAPTGGLVIGDCVVDSDFGGRNPKPTNCSDPRAVMELVSKGAANAPCPDGKRRNESAYTTVFWADATMCFAANFVEGDCYSVNTVDPSKSPFKFESCGSRDAQIKVAQRVDGTTDPTACRPGLKPISYPQPARLYCLQPAG